METQARLYAIEITVAVEKGVKSYLDITTPKTQHTDYTSCFHQK